MKNELSHLLTKHWKTEQFRPLQEAACLAVLDAKDTLVLFPTGGGKSLCYQLPSLLFKGPTLVISPLISLMQDQVNQANKKGIKSMMFDASQNIQKQLDNAAFGHYKLLYCSPEKIQNTDFTQRLKTLNIQCIAVDEAHCISQWGNDFRPAYRKIGALREKLQNVPIIALTASATPAVLKDIQSELRLEQAQIYRRSFERKNIRIEVKKTEDKRGHLLRELKNHRKPTIIYCSSRKETENLAAFLNQKQFPALYFHGGLSQKEKEKRLLNWQEEKTLIVVATNAFGMGIDKDNVGLVVHLNLPASIEHYYQEIGRAGRNEQAAKALLLYGPADQHRAEEQYINSHPNSAFIEKCYKHLCNYLNIGVGEGFEQEWSFEFSAFCNTYKLPARKVDHCLTLLDQYSIFRRLNSHKQWAICQFLCSYTVFKRELEHSTKTKTTVLQSIGRQYPGIFDQEIRLDLDEISRRTRLPFSTVMAVLTSCKKQNLIEFRYAQNDLKLQGLTSRENHYTLATLLKHSRVLFNTKKEKVNAMVAFAQSEKTCKQKSLLAYFGEDKKEDCTLCSASSCEQSTSPTGLEDVAQKILALIEQQPFPTHQLKLSLSDYPVSVIAAALNWLEEHGKIGKNELEEIIRL